jgi:pilus assembly protein TadC
MCRRFDSVSAHKAPKNRGFFVLKSFVTLILSKRDERMFGNIEKFFRQLSIVLRLTLRLKLFVTLSLLKRDDLFNITLSLSKGDD